MLRGIKFWPVLAGAGVDLGLTLFLAIAYAAAALAMNGGDESALDAPMSSTGLAVSLAVGLMCSWAGGLTSGWMAKDRFVQHGLAVGLIGVALGLSMALLSPDPELPLWHSVLSLGGMIPASVWGSVASRRFVERATQRAAEARALQDPSSSVPGLLTMFKPSIHTEGESAGMLAAGRVSLAAAAITLLGWLIAREGLPVSAAIDLFLGVKLMKLEHRWRFWATLRAWAGLLLSVIALGVLLVTGGTSFVFLVAGSAMYCGAMLLFLVGSPTMARIRMGRWVFGAAVGLMVAGIVVAAVQESGTESDSDIASASPGGLSLKHDVGLLPR
jgi:hypothetical protein